MISRTDLDREKSDDFYDSLIFVATFYSSLGNLEDALIQLGEGLPSKTIIQKTILELFE